MYAISSLLRAPCETNNCRRLFAGPGGGRTHALQPTPENNPGRTVGAYLPDRGNPRTHSHKVKAYALESMEGLEPPVISCFAGSCLRHSDHMLVARNRCCADCNGRCHLFLSVPTRSRTWITAFAGPGSIQLNYEDNKKGPLSVSLRGPKTLVLFHATYISVVGAIPSVPE